MTLDDLDLLREGWDFEAKLAQGRDGQGQLPRSFWETYSAMANANGGRVVLGLREHPDGSFELRGLANPAKLERDLWNTLENRNKVSVNLLEAHHVRVENVDGAKLLVIEIPRAPRQDRPVHLNDDLLGQTYIRVHEGDRRITDRERIRRMLADAISDTRVDRVLPKYDERDLDADTLRAYRNLFAAHRVDDPWSVLDNRDFLRQLGAWGRDRETDAEGLTLAGLLMFGQYRSIRELLPNYFPDYQWVRNLDDGDWGDRIWPDGTWSGNLFDTYRRVIQRLTADLKIPFRLDADLFRVHETHVHEAIREALVNAIIHADWEGRSSLLVKHAPTGIRIRNAGLPRLPNAQIFSGGLSDCRNRTLQGMFLHVGLGENAGSGFHRILRAWREQTWHHPNLISDTELEVTTLVLAMVHLVPAAVLEGLEEQFGRAFRELAEPQRLAMALAAHEGSVTHKRLHELLDDHSRDLTLALHGLVQRGMLRSAGSGRYTTYTIPPTHDAGLRINDVGSRINDVGSRLNDPGSDPKDPGSSAKIPGPKPNDVGSGAKDSGSGAKDSGSGAKDSGSGAKDSGSGAKDPGSESSLIRRVSNAKRAKITDMREAILRICANEFVSTDVLATRLNREVRSLQRRLLRPMVRDGLLTLAHPDRPSHPQQAYRAAPPGEPT